MLVTSKLSFRYTCISSCRSVTPTSFGSSTCCSAFIHEMHGTKTARHRCALRLVTLTSLSILASLFSQPFDFVFDSYLRTRSR